MVWDCVSSRCDRRLHRRGRNASPPGDSIRFVSRFIPAEPGPSLSVVLCLVTIGCIVCVVPVWVPLCMVAGLIFGVPVGAAHKFVALWTGSTLSVMIGRYFFREPIRKRLFDGDFPTSRPQNNVHLLRKELDEKVAKNALFCTRCRAHCQEQAFPTGARSCERAC